MSNTGQIKRYSHTGGHVGDMELDNCGKFIKYDDHLNIVNNLVMRIAELELALLYYADEVHFKNGDVPGHIYALDDAGHIARNALGIDQKEVDRRVLATYYTE